MRQTAQVFRQAFPDWQAGQIFRVQDGMVVERWGRTDDLGLLRQLGIVPAMST